MQIKNYDGVVSGFYDVKIHIREHDVFGEYETYSIEDRDIPNGIRCMMCDEFEHEHGVAMIDVADIRWKIVFNDEKKCFLELSGNNVKKKVPCNTMMQLELTKGEMNILNQYGVLGQ